MEKETSNNGEESYSSNFETTSSSETTISNEDEVTNAEEESNTYIIRPCYYVKFNAGTVREILKSILIEEFGNKRYSSIDVPAKARSLSEVIVNKMKELPYERYKYAVQVVIGEQRGQGFKMTSSCFWDADTDNC
ncbi:Tctex1 domain-containing protein 2, partial [Stegodyphus mimosarum]